MLEGDRPDHSPSIIGQTVNGYTFISEISAGSEATVFKVRSERYGCDFAAKVMTNRKLDAANSAELAAMRALDHPHVIRLYDFFDMNGDLVLIYELCRGGSLADEMGETPQGFGRERFLEVARQLVSAVAACHAASISHGDLKAENCLWCDAGRRCARLSDFGFAKFGRSRTYSRSGTVGFLAPEALEGRGPINPFAADVWALGVTFAEMLCGAELWACTDLAARDAILRSRQFVAGDAQLSWLLSLMLRPVNSRATIQRIAALPVMKPGQPRPKLPHAGLARGGKAQMVASRSLSPHITGLFAATLAPRVRGRSNSLPVRVAREVQLEALNVAAEAVRPA